MMTKFEVGKMYQGVIERTGAVRYFEVVRRTPKFITIRGEMVCGTEKIRVKESDGIETAQYDCAWLHYQLRADKGILDEETSNEAKTPMTQTTEQTLECFKTEIETCKTRTESEMKSMFENRESDKQSGMNMPELPEADSEVTEALKPAENESKNEVQRVMAAITAVNYEPKATREILKTQTENFRHAALQIFYVGLGGFWNKELRKKVLIEGFIGVKETCKRQEYLKNTAIWLRIGQDNIEYCRENEEFRQHLPEFEERQRYYQEWQEYLESYEVRKELSA